MQITIAYDSSWRNSLLDGDNNEPLPKTGRNYKASLSNLNPKQKGKESTYDYKNISDSTVMGVLNRLIGDQRKLYQSKKDDSYFFKKIESKVTFFDDTKETQEMIYLRNMLGSFDQNSFIGSIKTNHPLISSEFSPELWGILNLDLPQLLEFILNEKVKIKGMGDIDPFFIIEKIKSYKNISTKKFEEGDLVLLNNAIELLNNNLILSADLKSMYPKMQKSFDGGVYIKGDLVQIGSLYCSALYIQVLRLSKIHDLSGIILKGISVNNITPKNFLEPFTGGQKRIW